MGYDMYAEAPERAVPEIYFRLNVWGMGGAREWLDKFDLLADAEHGPWPDSPDDTWPEREDVEPGTPWADFYAAQDAILAEHPNRDDPALPYYKLCSNDGWFVTPVECQALVGAWNQRGGPDSEAPDYVKEFVAWIDSVSRYGFKVH